MLRILLAASCLFSLTAVASAGWPCYGCRIVRPVVIAPVPVVQPVAVTPVVIQPQPVNATIVRRVYRTPIRDGLFGRYRVLLTPAQPSCTNGDCGQGGQVTPSGQSVIQPTPDPKAE